MNRHVLLPLMIVCLWTLSCFSSAAPAEQADAKKPAEKLLPNPSFEEEAAGKPAGWATQTWGGEATFRYADTGHTGRRSVMIASDSGADASWTVTVPVDPDAQYRLSGWIKTEEVKTLTTKGRSARGALLNLHNIQGIATKAVTGTRDWTKVQIVFDSGGNNELQVNCLFGGWGLATGRAWFDDIRLEKLSMKDWKPTIAIDTRKTGEPISKYIYGQFIEHLGRCIYGGIWAEMLDDRKFFDAVGGKSPWKTIGDETVVKMVKADSFVGNHTPEITLPGDEKPGGIVQGGLGLIKGKAYVGRIWLAGDPQAAPVKVSLVWGEGPGGRQTVTAGKLGKDYAKTPLKFTAGGDSNNGRLEITAAGMQIVVKLNGRQVLEYLDPKPLGRGFIGLGYFNSGPIEFRNIKLKPLGMRRLFNGRDLTGWKTYPQLKSVCTVTEKGELNIKRGKGQLETVGQYGDFTLQLEVFVNGKGLNSGIFFRCIPGDIMNGYESQIHNGFKDGDRAKPSDCGSGGFFRRQNARRVVADDFAWFGKTIHVDDKHMAVWVNGYQVSDWTDNRKPNKNPRRGLRLEPGTIIIQGHDPTTDLSFRNLRISELPER